MAGCAALLQGLQSADNAVRNGAEAQYAQAKTQPEALIPGLVEILQQPAMDPGTKQLAAVELRKLLAKNKDPKLDLYSQLGASSTLQLRGALLQLVFADGQAPLQRKALAAATGALGSRLIDENGWPELLATVAQALQAGSPDAQCSALSIVGDLTSLNYDAGMKPHLGAAAGMFQSALASEHFAVRVAAGNAALGAARNVGKELAAPFAVLVGPLMGAVSAVLSAGKAEEARGLIERLHEVATENPTFLIASGMMQAVFDAMFQIAQTEALDESLRRSAVEFLVSFSESEPRQAKKIPQFAERVVPLLMGWCLNPPEADVPDAAWGQTEFPEDDDDATFFDAGQEGLDRLATALGGKAFARFVLSEVTKYLSSPEYQQSWRHRYAAILALNQTAEGCAKQYRDQLPGMVGQVLGLFNDPQPRVRQVALQCIAQFCSDFCPKFQKKFGDQVLPAIIQKMQDPVPRVRGLAASSIINFCDRADEESYAHHIEGMLVALHAMLARPDEATWIKEEALSSVADVAEEAGKTFANYYDHFMPVIKAILAMPEEKGNLLLKGRAIGCAGWMAVAAGKEKFSADSEAVMGYMGNLSRDLAADDPRTRYLLPAWGRLARCVGEQFAAYVDALLPFIMQLASRDDEAKLLDDGDEGGGPARRTRADCLGEGEHEVTTIKLAQKGAGAQTLSVRTSILEEKELALGLLRTLFTKLGTVMASRVQPIMNVVLPQDDDRAPLLCKFSEPVRQAAAAVCPAMIKAVKECVEKQLMPAGSQNQLLHFIVPKLVHAVRQEADVQVAADIMEALKDSIEECGSECVDVQHITKTVQTVHEVFTESLKRNKELEKQTATAAQEDDEDEKERIGEKVQEEENLLSAVVDVVAAFIKTHPSFVPIFVQMFLPQFTQMLTPEFGDTEHKMSLYVLIDFVEHGGTHVQQFFPDICRALLMYAGSKCADVARAVAYGLGVCAEWSQAAPGRSVSESFAQQAVQALKAMCAAAPKDDDTWAASLCNAAGALLKFLRLFKGQPGVADEEILPVIFPLLPVYGDDDEAQNVHRTVFELVSQQHPVVVGPGGQNLPAIAGVAKQLLAKEKEESEVLADDATRQKVTQLVSMP